MDDEIDPAKAQLAYRYQDQVIQHGDVVYQWTSTCSTANMIPKRIPILSGQAQTPRLYASIAADYAAMSTTFRRQYRIECLSNRYGKSARTIETALSLFDPST